jgi:hypothetical protein
MAPGADRWEETRALIESETGPVSSAQVLSSGRNSEISVIVHAAGEATFVKGRRAGHPQAWTQEREKAVNPLVRHVSPRLKWSAADDAWSLLGYEAAPGAHADYRPGSRDLPKVAGVLRKLQDVTLPGGIEVKQAEDRWRAYTDRPELLAGPALLHTDWTPGNVLVSDRARLVDWAWPTRGLRGSTPRASRPACGTASTPSPLRTGPRPWPAPHASGPATVRAAYPPQRTPRERDDHASDPFRRTPLRPRRHRSRHRH